MHMCILNIPIIIFTDFESIDVTNVFDDSFYLSLFYLSLPLLVYMLPPMIHIYYIKASESATPIIYCGRWHLHSGTNFRLITVSRFYYVHAYMFYVVHIIYPPQPIILFLRSSPCSRAGDSLCCHDGDCCVWMLVWEEEKANVSS